MDDSANWQWQAANRIRDVEELKKTLPLSDQDARGVKKVQEEYGWYLTPYYAGLIDRSDPRCPIRLQSVPDERELHDPLGNMDPLLEEEHNPAPNVIKVYPDRVAWTISNVCPVLCRHCLRKRMVGRENFDFSKEAREAAYDYFEKTPQIHDVLITGGDPLMYDDDFIEEILRRLREIPSIEIVRIGSRTPCTMPQRITPELTAMLKKYHPLYFNTQFNHPRELTSEAAEACSRLANAGIPLGNQSVLLRDINDTPEIMKKLVRGLLEMRVRPYYIYQAQTLSGTAHFRTPVERGIEIIKSLRGFTSGLAVPTYLLDTPYGKIPMHPETILRRDNDAVYLQTWDGNVHREPNPREAEPMNHEQALPGSR